MQCRPLRIAPIPLLAALLTYSILGLNAEPLRSSEGTAEERDGYTHKQTHTYTHYATDCETPAFQIRRILNKNSKKCIEFSLDGKGFKRGCIKEKSLSLFQFRLLEPWRLLPPTSALFLSSSLFEA